VSAPQLENGYLRIANELYEAILQHPFSKRELKIVLAVIRKTYGFGKKKDDISLSQIAEMTGLNAAHISRSINDLCLKGVLLKEQGRHAQSLEIIKNYRKWKVLLKQQRVTKTATKGCQKSKLPVTKTATTKDNSKDNTKRKRKEFTPPEINQVIQYFLDNGYTAESARKAFKYYSEAEPPWTDSTGKKVKSWKQKMVGVWFKPENEIGHSRTNGNSEDAIFITAKRFGLHQENGESIQTFTKRVTLEADRQREERDKRHEEKMIEDQKKNDAVIKQMLADRKKEKGAQHENKI